MRISYLKSLLGMYPDDTEILIQTVPADLCSPLDIKHLSLSRAFLDKRMNYLEPEKLILTAYHPEHPINRPPARDGLVHELVEALVLATPFVEGHNDKVEADIKNAIKKARAA
jgi:hypothetical protein